MTAARTLTPKGVTAATMAGAIALATPLIMMFEGNRPVGYRDIVGVPTSCYGHTGPDAIVGKRYTPDECNTQLAKDVASHAAGIRACIKVDVPKDSLAAFISFSFNVGVGGFCRSSLARKLNAGDLVGACNGLSAWVYAGGKRIRGLENRRAKERALCLKGAAA